MEVATQSEQAAAWALATKADSPVTFRSFYQEFPGSPYLKTVTGTLRGRYWFKLNMPFGDGGKRRDGVIVTVEGMDLAMNLSLADAKDLGVIGSVPAASTANPNAQGTTFNYKYFEATDGGVVVGSDLITPKDSLKSTIILSADGSRLLAWDLSNSTPAPHPSTQPTVKKGLDGKYPCGPECP